MYILTNKRVSAHNIPNWFWINISHQIETWFEINNSLKKYINAILHSIYKKNCFLKLNSINSFLLLLMKKKLTTFLHSSETISYGIYLIEFINYMFTIYEDLFQIVYNRVLNIVYFNKICTIILLRFYLKYMKMYLKNEIKNI